MSRGLQQFVNQSPWDERVVRANLARRMVSELEPEAWIVDDTGYPKTGRCSVGVGRHCSGTLGRVDNCQIGVSVNAASGDASCPLDWRIFLPASWDADEERRRKAHVLDEVRHREKRRLALDTLDELAWWGLRPPLVAADAGYGEIAAFRQAWTTAGSPTSCRSRPAPPLAPSTSGPSGPSVPSVAAHPLPATARSPARWRTWHWLRASAPPAA
jgi:SRSO17 transposase